MCFRHDYDWYADVYETTKGPAPEATRCDECGCRIHAGEWRMHVFMQESEECQNAEHDHADEDAVIAGDCDFGIEDEYDRCERCHQLIDAIRLVEEGEGCTGHSSLPPLTQLDDAMDKSDHVEEYHERAMALYPSLAASGHLGRFARIPVAEEETWTAADLAPVEEIGGEG